MDKKYPFEILLENSPISSELDHQFENDNTEEGREWWQNMSPERVIQEVEEILGRYNIGSGWVHAEEIEKGGEDAIREQKELRAVVKHMKKRYNQFYK